MSPASVNVVSRYVRQVEFECSLVAGLHRTTRSILPPAVLFKPSSLQTRAKLVLKDGPKDPSVEALPPVFAHG